MVQLEFLQLFLQTLLQRNDIMYFYIVSTMNHTSQHDVLEISYINVGSMNTTIRWFSSLTCHSSVFTIEWYAALNPDQLGTPTLTLNSTSFGLTIPNNIANNGSQLYWRLLAHEWVGMPCAQNSANRYYQWDTNGEMFPIK